MEPARCWCDCECCTGVASSEAGTADPGAVRPATQARLRLVTFPETPPRRRVRPEAPHRLIGAGLLLVLGVFGLLVWTASTVHVADVRVGLRAPTFSLPALDPGRDVGTAELTGMPAIVVFWSPGCAPCGEELRRLQAVWERHRSRGLVVLGVQEGPVAAADASGFLAANGVTFPNLHDRSGAVGGAFGVMGVPEAHFIDPQWRIQGIDRGDAVGVDRQAGLTIWDPIPPDVLDRRVVELLGADRVDGAATRPGSAASSTG